MPRIISEKEIQELIRMINAGKIDGAYRFLSDRGYDYAQWASDVKCVKK